MKTDNNAGNLEMTELFALRLLSAWIVEIKNSDPNTIADIYNRTLKKAFIASKRFRGTIFRMGIFSSEIPANHQHLRKHCKIRLAHLMV
jgi:hypothetical protein